MTQTDYVLIALTRDVSGPRTVANIAVETGIPNASVRRILSTLTRAGRIVRNTHIDIREAA